MPDVSRVSVVVVHFHSVRKTLGLVIRKCNKKREKNCLRSERSTTSFARLWMTKVTEAEPRSELPTWVRVSDLELKLDLLAYRRPLSNFSVCARIWCSKHLFGVIMLLFRVFVEWDTRADTSEILQLQIVIIYWHRWQGTFLGRVKFCKIVVRFALTKMSPPL